MTDYAQYITSEYSNQPNFVSVVEGFTSLPSHIQDLLAAMIPLFDLDTPPVGDQLDIIGQWIGVSRNILVPIPGADVFFTWDSTVALGWDSGTWAPLNQNDNPIPPSPQEQITILPDDAYLTLIKATIAANQWDGTTESAYKIWQLLFPTIMIAIQDYCDMSYAVLIVGIIPALSLALLTGGYIRLKPEGVRITGYFTIPDGPVFAFDVVTGIFRGWDTGKWATVIAPGL